MVKHLPTMWETRVQSLGWEDLLEKEMATHSSTLACKIPWMEKPSRLQSMGSQRVEHDWATSLSTFKATFGLPWWFNGKEYTCQWRRHKFHPWVKKIPWRMRGQPTPVFFPRKSHQQKSLEGYSPWGCKRIRHDLATNQQQQKLLLAYTDPTGLAVTSLKHMEWTQPPGRTSSLLSIIEL